MRHFYSVRELIDGSPDGSWAIPGFNIFNMEFAQAVVEAAQMEGSPVILMMGDPIVPFAGLDTLIDICESVTRNATVPVALLLDHGKTEAHLSRCIERGVSIMFDGSEMPLHENIAQSAAWMNRAHAAGVSIEAELGSFGAEFSEESGEQSLTSADECRQFVAGAAVDMLAVGVGNYHGKYKAEPRIDLARLSEISDAIAPIPPTLHGASGIPRDTVRACVENGVRKINYGYDLKYAFADSLRQSLSKEPMPFQPPSYLAPAREAVVQVVRDRIADAGSSGLAKGFNWKVGDSSQAPQSR